MAKPFRRLPALPGVRPAGWAALADRFDIQAPVRNPTCVAESFIRGGHRIDSGWHIFDKRYWPGDTATDHLEFALRHETLDLVVLKRALQATDPAELEALLRAKPTGIYSRRLWYFYEALTGQLLDLEDAPTNPAIDLIDPKLYFTAKPQLSKRHRVRDNLLGTPQFCPVIRRTKTLEAFLAVDLAAKARDIVNRAGPALINRAASFLMLADTRASFAIEGESPPRNRLELWARAVAESVSFPLSVDEVVRLQSILLEDSQANGLGIRTNGVFIGHRDRFFTPQVEFVGARPEDLKSLLDGWLEANSRMAASGLDAALQAAATAFSFVYIHPFSDGNGRVHRYLIHHVLAERGFAPAGLVFPVSSAMLDKAENYRAVLQSHTKPILGFIDWFDNEQNNVEVRSDTADFYRYFDCTEAAEFLSKCITRTVRQDLPQEIDFLRRHGEAMKRLIETVRMPNGTAENLIMFIRQNAGKLPIRRREMEFAFLTGAHVEALETIVNEAFKSPQS